MPLGSISSPTDKRLENYAERAVRSLASALGSSGSDIDPVKSRAGQMYGFTLPGDQRAGQGRMLVTSGGEVKIWHQTLQRPWLPDSAFTQIEIGGDKGRGPTPGYKIGLKDFESLQPGVLACVRQKPRDIEATHRLRPQLSDGEVHALALTSLLAAGGWNAQRSAGGITYLTDGEGRGAAGRLVVNDGIAVCWSHRGDLKLGDPWRPGRDLKDGTPCMFATGRDLAGIGLSVVRPAVELSLPQQITDQQKIASIQATWARIQDAAMPCPAGQRHLVKGAASIDKALPAVDLMMIPGGKLEGAIAVPMLRESDAPGRLHVIGIQALLAQPGGEGNDKQLLAGSSIAGSFTPWPLPPVSDGKFDLGAWVEASDKSKPIVLCEGVATALAVHHSGAGHAVICYSSSNLPTVAKYFAEREFDATHGIVVAADNDIGLKRDGSLKSVGVIKAVEAARACGGEVAFMGRSGAVGADARDLYVADGPGAVQRYIDRAQRPDEVEQRFERVIQERREALEKSQSMDR